MAKLTVNSNGMLENAQEFIDNCVSTYKSYLQDLFAQKAVEDLSMNEMAFIRLVSSSSILSMKKSGNTMLEILNKPVNKPSIAASKPVTEDAVRAFMAKLSPEKRKELFGF
jgi:hypothetical protein